jgi:hypothetical protein
MMVTVTLALMGWHVWVIVGWHVLVLAVLLSGVPMRQSLSAKARWELLVSMARLLVGQALCLLLCGLILKRSHRSW